MHNTAGVAIASMVMVMSFSGTMAAVTEEIKAAAVRVGNVLAAKYGEDADVGLDSKFKSVMNKRYKSAYQYAFVRRGSGWRGSMLAYGICMGYALVEDVGIIGWPSLDRRLTRYGNGRDNELSMKYTAILERNANDDGCHVRDVVRNFLSDYVPNEDCIDEGQFEMRNALADLVTKLVGDELKNVQTNAATKSVAVTTGSTGKAPGDRITTA